MFAPYVILEPVYQRTRPMVLAHADGLITRGTAVDTTKQRTLQRNHALAS
jgi:hypothetical protein